MALVTQSGARLPSSLERCIPGVHIRENRLRKYARFMHQYRAFAHAPSSPPPPLLSFFPPSLPRSSLPLLARVQVEHVDRRKGREKGEFSRGKKMRVRTYVCTYARWEGRGGFIMFNSRFRVSFRDTGSISA